MEILCRFFEKCTIIHVKLARWKSFQTGDAIVDETVGYPQHDKESSTVILDSNIYQQQGHFSVAKSISYFHLHMISDATGETLLSAGRAVSAQYPSHRAIEHIYPLIRSESQLRDVMGEIDAEPGIVLYTVVDETIADEINKACQKMGVPCASVLDPVISTFQSYLGQVKMRRASAQHVLNADYFHRIDALNFTMEHDDGQMLENIDEADIILVGISRTSKTPTSIYLANRGIKTANVPLVPQFEVPIQLLKAKNPLIVGLVASVDRVATVRSARDLDGGINTQAYIDRIEIAEELNYARRICNRQNWPLIDVTRRSIEETAAAILALRPRYR